jgi:hypothetical protein
MTDDSPNFAALVAAAAHPQAVVMVKCLRCRTIHVPGPDPDLRLCRPCLRQVQALFVDDDERTDPSAEASA